MASKNKLRIACTRIVQFCETHTYLHLFYYLIIIVSAIIIIFAQYPPFLSWVAKMLPVSFLSFLKEIKVPIMISCVLIAVGLPNLRNLIYGIAKSEPSLADANTVAALFSALDIIVGHKLNKLNKYRRARVTSKKKMYEEIIQPEEQIALIFLAIYNFFEKQSAPKSVDLSMTIICCENNQFVTDDYYDYYPQSRYPSCSVSSLVERSVAKNALTNRQSYVINDVSKEKDFIPFSDPEMNSGSLICYPIIDIGPKGEVIYILTVLANRANHFDKRNRKYYNYIIDKFAERIILEHQYKVLKQPEIGAGK